jgi:hypothetical protein
MDTRLESKFSQILLNTLEQSFPEVYYKNVWWNKNYFVTNFIITNKNIQDYNKVKIEEREVYTDNKHSIELDLFQLNNEWLK